jgi:RNA polymerase sigma-70 factor (ECF subfamily)
MDSAPRGVDDRGMAGGDITELLGRMSDGDRAARDELVPLVYRDLEAIAAAYARPGESLEPRGLVHELYLRLARSRLDARDRKHFYAVAALAMRQILVDRARRRKARRRGGDALRVTLSGLPGVPDGVELIAIEDALRRLEELSPRQARIVELRCLVGLSVVETAEAIGASERTVAGEWRLARAWLVRALRGEPGEE